MESANKRASPSPSDGDVMQLPCDPDTQPRSPSGSPRLSWPTPARPSATGRQLRKKSVSFVDANSEASSCGSARRPLAAGCRVLNWGTPGAIFTLCPEEPPILDEAALARRGLADTWILRQAVWMGRPVPVHTRAHTAANVGLAPVVQYACVVGLVAQVFVEDSHWLEVRVEAHDCFVCRFPGDACNLNVSAPGAGLVSSIAAALRIRGLATPAMTVATRFLRFLEPHLVSVATHAFYAQLATPEQVATLFDDDGDVPLGDSFAQIASSFEEAESQLVAVGEHTPNPPSLCPSPAFFAEVLPVHRWLIGRSREVLLCFQWGDVARAFFATTQLVVAPGLYAERELKGGLRVRLRVVSAGQYRCWWSDQAEPATSCASLEQSIEEAAAQRTLPPDVHLKVALVLHANLQDRLWEVVRRQRADDEPIDLPHDLPHPVGKWQVSGGGSVTVVHWGALEHCYATERWGQRRVLLLLTPGLLLVRSFERHRSVVVRVVAPGCVRTWFAGDAEPAEENNFATLKAAWTHLVASHPSLKVVASSVGALVTQHVQDQLFALCNVHPESVGGGATSSRKAKGAHASAHDASLPLREPLADGGDAAQPAMVWGPLSCLSLGDAGASFRVGPFLASPSMVVTRAFPPSNVRVVLKVVGAAAFKAWMSTGAEPTACATTMAQALKTLPPGWLPRREQRAIVASAPATFLGAPELQALLQPSAASLPTKRKRKDRASTIPPAAVAAVKIEQALVTPPAPSLRRIKPPLEHHVPLKALCVAALFDSESLAE